MAEEEVYASDRAAWRAWLSRNADRTSGVWLIYDKGTNRRLSYEDIVEEALCVGWIDSRPRTLDENRAKLYIAPRKKRSSWSALNKRRIQKLAAAGMMQARGLAVVEAAKADGSWNGLDAVETLAEPAELKSALDAEPAARAHWNAFPPSVRRAILEWISNAKTESTRSKRIEKTVQDAAAGRRANQWRQPKDRRPTSGSP